jgi:gamma-glutamyltranspeptidase/glutathione hydrolase
MKFNFLNPYPTTRLPVFARNVVSTSHPLAAQAGLRMLWTRAAMQSMRPLRPQPP